MFSHTTKNEFPTPDATYNTSGIIQTPLAYYGQPGTSKGADIISTWNNNHYGLISWFCHGGSGPGAYNCTNGTSNIATMTNGLNVPGENSWKLNAQDNHPYCAPNVQTETGNGLNNLTNSNYQSILYSISCDVTPYDITSQNGKGGGMNCGEAFTKLSQTGGVAFLGNTRSGFVGTSYLLYEAFADLITSNDYYSHLGIAEAISKNNYNSHYLSYTHNLIGCPETEMWTAQPEDLIVSTTPSDLTLSANNTVTVTIYNLPDGKQATVCLYKENDILLAPHYITGTGNPVTETFTNVNPSSTGNLNVTVTTHNYIPNQSLIPVCAFNTTPLAITTNQTLNSVTIVDCDITVYSPATLTVNSKLYLNHNATFTIKSGATLIVNSTGSILGGCDSSLSPAWDGTFVGELGANLTINA